MAVKNSSEVGTSSSSDPCKSDGSTSATSAGGADDAHKTSNADVAHEVDACGLRCPLPLLRAKQALRDLAPGEALKVSATDSGSVRDFQAFAELSGHQLLARSEEGGVYTYILLKS